MNLSYSKSLSSYTKQLNKAHPTGAPLLKTVSLEKFLIKTIQL